MLKASVKFGQSQVELLKKVCRVLEPFYRATLQLSNDSSCISEVCKCNCPSVHIKTHGQVIPIVTQLRESLTKVSDDERGRHQTFHTSSQHGLSRC